MRRSPKNTTVHRVVNTTFIFDSQPNDRDPAWDRGRYSRKARSAKCISIPIDKTRGAKRQTRRRDRPHPKRAKRAILLLSFNPRRPRTKGPDGFPPECIPQHEALSKRAKRAIIPPAVIRRRPDIAGPAISLLLGTLRRTQEALAARSAQRGLLACPRTCLKVN